MSVICKKAGYHFVRLLIAGSLTFFVLSFLTACSRSERKGGISLRWKARSAVAIALPKGIVDRKNISVRLFDEKQTSDKTAISIFGEISIEADSIVFTPLVPFTRGLTYEVISADQQIGKFSIPIPTAADAPQVIAVYPTQETLPENLLKIYLYFSQPMQEGVSAKYVNLIKNRSDTVKAAFLDLQPELWNEDNTRLTLWLDPGRIKRDLRPNLALGAPLEKHQRYRLSISENWKDKQGALLAKGFSKEFVTTNRDTSSPAPSTWTIKPPAPGTSAPLQINFHESLDHGLLGEVMQVLNKDNKLIAGNWKFTNEETIAIFTPSEPWKTGTYTLNIENRLEDLAANNITRPFDRELGKKQLIKEEKISTLSFQVER